MVPPVATKQGLPVNKKTPNQYFFVAVTYCLKSMFKKKSRWQPQWGDQRFGVIHKKALIILSITNFGFFLTITCRPILPRWNFQIRSKYIFKIYHKFHHIKNHHSAVDSRCSIFIYDYLFLAVCNLPRQMLP